MKTIGVLGGIGPQATMDVEARMHRESQRLIPPRMLNSAIFRLMEGRDDEEERRLAREAVERLRGPGVEGIILGCTELPLLLREHAEAADLLNPAQLLAEAAVRHALDP